MTLIANLNVVRTAHCQYYATIAAPIFNLTNPHVFAEFEEGAGVNENNWDITFKIWDKRKYDERLYLKKFRAANPPKGVLFQNSHELVLIPTLFLLALFFASPITWKQKLLRGLVGLVIFYLFMSLYLSYRFEFTLNNQSLPLDSFWHILVSFFGLGGNTDPIFIVSMFIWLILAGPLLIKKLDLSKIFK
jgi:hypothetical protein